MAENMICKNIDLAKEKCINCKIAMPSIKIENIKIKGSGE